MKTGEIFVDDNIKLAADKFAAMCHVNDKFCDERERNAYMDGFIAGAAYLLLLNKDIKDKIKTSYENNK